MEPHQIKKFDATIFVLVVPNDGLTRSQIKKDRFVFYNSFWTVAFFILAKTFDQLRATAGEFAWNSIKKRINECDILVFDITPTKSVKAGRRRRLASRAAAKVVTPNVWLELGYALAKKDNVFVVHSKPNGHADLPSDLGGLDRGTRTCR